MAKINRPVLKGALNQVENLLADYMDKIDEAYIQAGDAPLDIALKIQLKPAPEGQIKITTSLGFVESRVKDSQTVLVDPRQRNLFGEDDSE